MVSIPSVEGQPQTPSEKPTAGIASHAWLQKALAIFQQQGALLALIFVTVFSFVRYSNFDLGTIILVLDYNTQFGLIALGMAFVIMTGGIDLSVGGVAALSSVVVALNYQHGFTYAVVLAILVGAIVGAVNGFIVAWLGLPPFLTTLATLYIVRGMALNLIPGQDSLFIDPNSNFGVIANMTFGAGFLSNPIPFTIPLLFIAFLIGMYALRYTRFGRYALTIGGNIDAARLMGLPIKRTLFLVYTLSGTLAGLAGVMIARSSGGIATEGKGWELIAIAAVVVGGTLLSGGVGSIFGTLVGVLLLGLIVEILQLENNYVIDNGAKTILFNAFWQDVIRGLFLFAVVVLQSRLQQRNTRSKTL